MSVAGVGPIISTALVAAIGDGEAFDRGRDFGALARSRPSTIQHRRQNRARTHLETGQHLSAHAVHPGREGHHHATQNWEKFSFGTWLKEAAPRLHRNKLATALANKLARIRWSVLRNGRSFDTHGEALAI